MMDTTTQSGQRPPNANRLTPAEWAEAVERAAGTFWNASHAVRWRRTGKESPSTLAYLNNANAALRAAFPHLAPNPED